MRGDHLMGLIVQEEDVCSEIDHFWELHSLLWRRLLRGIWEVRLHKRAIVAVALRSPSSTDQHHLDTCENLRIAQVSP